MNLSCSSDCHHILPSEFMHVYFIHPLTLSPIKQQQWQKHVMLKVFVCHALIFLFIHSTHEGAFQRKKTSQHRCFVSKCHRMERVSTCRWQTSVEGLDVYPRMEEIRQLYEQSWKARGHADCQVHSACSWKWYRENRGFQLQDWMNWPHLTIISRIN